MHLTRKVEDYLNEVSYSDYSTYVPSTFATEFVQFIKLVNGLDGVANTTPLVHYQMLDQLASTKKASNNIANLCCRGMAKTTLFGEYLFLFLAVYGEIEGYGKVKYALYVSDSMDNGVKSMRRRLEYRLEHSEFLQRFITSHRFTDNRWEFTNASNIKFVVTGHGATTGVRGRAELGTRPQLAIMDDLISDSDARSPTVIATIEDTIYKAIDHALTPDMRKIIWSGTPFNANDPLYKAIESGAWQVNVFPICEKFPCTEEEFKSSWVGRFTYEFVLDKYTKAKAVGKLDTFYQELMLRIMSDEERLLKPDEIKWFSRKDILTRKDEYNFYITTDFATTENTSGDFSVISIWAINNVGHWFWVDGQCIKQLMGENVDDLFKYVQLYKPQAVGIEVSGQQGGFVSWIDREMIRRNSYFNWATDNNSNRSGIRPIKDKMSRFLTVLPFLKRGHISFPKEWEDEPVMLECMDELSLATKRGFKAKHDDFIDTVSMLTVMNPWLPSETSPIKEYNSEYDMWEDEYSSDDNFSPYESYIV